MKEKITHNENATKKIAADLVKELQKPTFLCLYGDLGSGKTTFSKGLAQALGIEEKTIKSPTYTFVRSYELKRGKQRQHLYHFDFYRIEEVDELMAQDLQEIFRQKNTWIIAEWPERILKLLPEDRLECFLEYVGPTSRKIKIDSKKSQNSIKNPRTQTSAEVEKWLKAYRVPAHIRKHMEKVAATALFIGQKMLEQGQKVNLKILEEAALLHDFLKLCDFPQIDEFYFEEKLTPDDRTFWQKMIKKYHKKGHAQAAFEVLKAAGKKQIAKLIRVHDFRCLTAKKPEDRPRTLEAKILYYADKRVRHDQVVSLKERIDDGRRRYFPDGNIPKDDDRIVQKLFQLEKELLTKAHLKPNHLNEKNVKTYVSKLSMQ